ncbi:hypothetical protein ABZW11_04950 [Nonomuraea sp. NPDC004580]|uniref:hypothetical protein n=1 Tax=Nonomuraea sp. NPDC004580 TaxID=3154552 RepID=UPI00339E75C3
MKPKPEDIQKGVAEAFWDFIANHRDYSTLDAIQAGTKEAVREWLNEHADDITAAIAAAVAKGYQP